MATYFVSYQYVAAYNSNTFSDGFGNEFVYVEKSHKECKSLEELEEWLNAIKSDVTDCFLACSGNSTASLVILNWREV